MKLIKLICPVARVGSLSYKVRFATLVRSCSALHEIDNQHTCLLILIFGS